jgi:hypothetical protein
LIDEVRENVAETLKQIASGEAVSGQFVLLKDMNSIDINSTKRALLALKNLRDTFKESAIVSLTNDEYALSKICRSEFSGSLIWSIVIPFLFDTTNWLLTSIFRIFLLGAFEELLGCKELGALLSTFVGLIDSTDGLLEGLLVGLTVFSSLRLGEEVFGAKVGLGVGKGVEVGGVGFGVST